MTEHASTGNRTATGPRRPSPQFSLVLLLLAAAVAYVGLAGLDQSLRAARGEGTPGTFTAAALTCVQHPGHRSCTCDGTFVPDSADAERGVQLHAAGYETCREGEPVPAVDAGAANRVYGPDGSREWLFSLTLLAGPVAVYAGVAAVWARWARSRSQRKARWSSRGAASTMVSRKRAAAEASRAVRTPSPGTSKAREVSSTTDAGQPDPLSSQP
jgi:hypothetical protein